MAAGARLSARAVPDARAVGRRFGLTVGGAFGVLSIVAHLRGADHPGAALGALALALVLGALLLPARLVPLERLWMRMAHAISRVTSPVMLGLIWVVVIVPIALARRALGKNALVRRAEGGGYWVRRETPRSDIDRQF